MLQALYRLVSTQGLLSRCGWLCGETPADSIVARHVRGEDSRPTPYCNLHSVHEQEHWWDPLSLYAAVVGVVVLLAQSTVFFRAVTRLRSSVAPQEAFRQSVLSRASEPSRHVSRGPSDCIDALGMARLCLKALSTRCVGLNIARTLCAGGRGKSGEERSSPFTNVSTPPIAAAPSMPITAGGYEHYGRGRHGQTIDLAGMLSGCISSRHIAAGCGPHKCSFTTLQSTRPGSAGASLVNRRRARPPSQAGGQSELSLQPAFTLNYLIRYGALHA